MRFESIQLGPQARQKGRELAQRGDWEVGSVTTKIQLSWGGWPNSDSLLGTSSASRLFVQGMRYSSITLTLYCWTQLASRDNCHTALGLPQISSSPEAPKGLPQDAPEKAVGLTPIRRMLLPDHVGSRKPGEPAMEGQWAKILLT